MIDKLSAYDELGVGRIILNVNFGCDPHETLDPIQYFAEEVMPHFTNLEKDCLGRKMLRIGVCKKSNLPDVTRQKSDQFLIRTHNLAQGLFCSPLLECMLCQDVED